jgi:hypothetical protein
LGSVAPDRVTASEMAAHLAKTIDNDDRLGVFQARTQLFASEIVLSPGPSQQT